MKTVLYNAIRCKHCGDVIESRHRHDYVFCSCGACAVDGGHDYLRRLKIHGTKITRNCQHGRKNRRKKYEDTTTVFCPILFLVYDIQANQMVDTYKLYINDNNEFDTIGG